MSFPRVLVSELRQAFKTSNRTNTFPQSRPLTTTIWRCQRAPTPTYGKAKAAKGSFERTEQQHEKSSESKTVAKSPTQSTDVVPRSQDGRALGGERRTPVPMRVVPKAQLTSNLTLKPLERLHVEQLTRRTPVTSPATKVYKEQLLVYHLGYGRQNLLAIVKVSTLCCLSLVAFIIAPAHISAGSPFWVLALISFGGFIPLIFVNWMTRPYVTQVWLQLPQKARQSAKAALEYARNIPDDATLDLRFLRVTGLEARVVARIRDLYPVLSGSWRPVTFKWQGALVDRGTTFRPNPTEFYVKPESAKGAASKDTIPGLWAAIYQKITGVQSDAVIKWRR